MAARCSALEGRVKAMEEVLNKRYSLSVLGETVLAQTGAISFKDGASFLSQHGVPTGQNRLFRFSREKKLLCSRKGRQWNKPTQKAIDAGLFKLQNLRRIQHNNADNAARAAISDGRIDS